MNKNTCRVESWGTERVVWALKRCEMEDFEDFVREKEIDGKKLLEVTEGIVKLWKPKINPKRFILFVEDLKLNPDKYLDMCSRNTDDVTTKAASSPNQVVKDEKTKEESSTSNMTIEDIIKRVVPVKSFLYRDFNKRNERIVSSYVPMDAGAPKKQRKFFRLSSYDYPRFDLRVRFSKTEFNDRGYYTFKNDKLYKQDTYSKPDAKTKYKTFNLPEDNEKITDDHYYEDLCYNEVVKEQDKKELCVQNQSDAVKPCLVKIQELFQSFKFPFFKRNAVTEGDSCGNHIKEKEGHIYENNDIDMYDSINKSANEDHSNSEDILAVEEYLEPIQVNKEYCDVDSADKEESLLTYIMNIFETFKLRRDTTEGNLSDDEPEAGVREPTSQNGGRKSKNMADRPLPVPVENEPFYMSIDRSEAENLLSAQPDGAFVLRPSSQPSHVYTLSVSCGGGVHNVGVRRRADGRLALGLARRGERSFAAAASLVRHHRKRRLLLVAAGGVIGATTLNDTPHYYQSPSSLPLSNM